MKKIFIIAICLLVPSLVFPHSGRTDRYGGHNNRKTGGYHYHNAGKSSNSNNPYQAKKKTSKELIIFSGYPFKKVEIVGMKSTEYELSDSDTNKNKVVIVENANRYYWKSRNNQELNKETSGIYEIFFAKNGSGYIKRIKESEDKQFIEHVHLGLETITYFGFEK